MGRNPDNQNDWISFSMPSPGAPNTKQDPPGEVLFSPASGVFQEISIEISLSLSGDSISSIYYTNDGSEPDSTSILYTSPFLIEESTVIKAIPVQSGTAIGKIVSSSYIIEKRNHFLPIVSISFNEDDFFSDSSGIYVLGKNGITGYCNNLLKRNYCQDWERKAHFEYFDNLGLRMENMDLGIKIHGNCSRNFPQKSLALFARGMYGKGKIDLPVFGLEKPNEFEALILRNSGNDNRNSMIRDALMAELVKGEMNIDYQAYQPVSVYLNGKYWGMYNLREKLNEHYTAGNHDVDPDNIDFIEDHDIVRDGDRENLEELMSFIDTAHLNYPSNYEMLQNNVDIEEFTNYLISEIYCANTDWVLNNVRYWRSRDAGGKWRWILYDTDFGFNLNDENHTTNMFFLLDNPATEENTPTVFISALFRKLMGTLEYRQYFLRQLSHHLNTTLSTDRVVKKIDSLVNIVEQEMQYHSERWNLNEDNWRTDIKRMKEFSVKRPEFIRQNIIKYLDDATLIELDIYTNENMGTIYLDQNKIISDSISGIYLHDMIIHLSAEPKEGYEFSGWKILTNTEDFISSPTIELTLTENIVIEAIFTQIALGTDLPESGNGDQIIVYPNPGNGLIRIQGINKSSVERISLYSLTGQLLISRPIENLVSDQFTIRLPSVYKGKFILRFENNGQSVTKVIIVE